LKTIFVFASVYIVLRSIEDVQSYEMIMFGMRRKIAVCEAALYPGEET